MRTTAPLSKTQEGIYTESLSNPESTLYNIPILSKLHEDVDVERLCNAVECFLKAYPSMNVRIFTDENGIPMQKIVEAENLRPDVFYLTDSEFEARREQIVRPFEMNGGKLYRFEIYVTPTAKYLLRDTHHMIFDGQSCLTYDAAIAKAYNGEAVPAETYTGLDVAADEQTARSSAGYTEDEKYYAELLDGCDTDCLPVRDVWSDTPGQAYYRHEFTLDEEAFHALRRKASASVTSFFTAVMGTLIAKYNAKTTSVISTIFNGRTEKNIGAISMLVKTVPFVTDFSDDPRIEDFLKKQTQQLFSTRSHTLYSFSELAAAHGVNSSINFGYQGNYLDYELLPGHEYGAGMLYDKNHIENTALLFEVEHITDSYSLRIGYRSDQFSLGFVREAAHAFAKIAQDFLRCTYMHEIELADDAAYTLIDSFNQTEVPYEDKKTVVEQFREQAQKTPDALCLAFEERHFTYAQVDAITDRLAKNLRAFGIGRNAVAGVLILRCEYMLLCSLGVLKAGGAYLPLDPTYPPERLNLMMQDSGAVLLMTTPELCGIITDDFAGRRIFVDDIPAMPDLDAALPTPEPDDLFVLLYTSGSTGVPKGVRFCHCNTMVTAAWERRFFELGQGCNNTAYASYGFDANVFDTYATITSGAALHIIPDSIRLDLLALQKYYNENNITHSTMTTQVGRQFALMEGTTTLRHLSVAGEKLTPLDPPANYKLYNLYGPTEGSILVTGFHVDKYYKDIPIGKAIDNVKLYVVDANGKLLPPGAAGELWITGPHVTAGYLNRPEKTAEAYSDNPFSDAPGYERAYHTGDIVRYLPDGNIQFIGRRDAQVKVRGFRVELTEVEEIVRRFPDIRDATVAAFDSPAGGKFIAAYIVSDKTVDIAALHDFIRGEKPPYMVPAVTMQIEKIPLNQNQKVNKKALPVPQLTFEDTTPPENEVQRKIFDIVAEVVGSSSFGIHTDIYEAGLTSIGAVRLNVLLSKAFDLPVKISDIKENDTVQKLEHFFTSAAKAEQYALLKDYPITQTQMGIFIESNAHPDSVTYNMPALFRIDDGIDAEKLIRAVRTALRAHPYVFATLKADADGNIRAVRRDNTEPIVERISCETVPTPAELVRPFSLLGAPLYRIAVYETEQGNFLFMDFHHIISDGTSEAILLADMEKAYAGLVPECESYTGFEAALDEEKARSSEKLQKAKAYYDSLLRGCDADCLPMKSPETEHTASRSLTRCCTVSAEQIERFCADNKLTVNAFFNAAFSYVLGQFDHRDEVVYTTIYNGRSDSRLSGAVTMLVKTIPVLARIDGEQKTVRFIRDMQTQLLNSFGNDIYAFAEISAAYGVKSDILFIYQGDSFTFDSICGKPAQMLPVGPEVAKAPITVNVYRTADSYKIVADYRQDLYAAPILETMMDCIEQTARGLTTCTKVRNISMLSDSTVAVIRRTNQTEHPFENIPVHRLVERYVETQPDRIAVTSSGARLTFKELNTLANRAAHTLLACGVKQNDIVALVLDRTVDLPVTELGILKAGGAFLGMLPSYPDDRIGFCLDNASCRVVITTEAIRAARPALFADDKPYKTLTVEQLMLHADTTNPDVEVRPDSLAYCIYTSGSTGTPKGVMIEHHNLANCVQTDDFPYALYCGNRSGKVVLSLASISFDMSVMDILMPLCNGMTACIATDEELHNPLALAKLMLENSVDTMACTPSFLTNYISMHAFRPAVQKLKTIVVGAEAFPAQLYTELKNLSPDLHILNGYGPTECTITCCCKPLSQAKNITIGAPSANTKFYVLDKFGNILPPYGCGELIICGECVGRGYVKLPEKTKAAFFTLNGLPAYHSGDVVRMNCDGEIEFGGRIDNQVKLRGFRVELDEIENVICAYEGVKQSKVIVRNNGAEDYLVGFFTAEKETDIERLTAFLKTKLTYYMVPDALMQLPEMPLNPSGKIDKKALPEVKKAGKKSGRRAPKKSTEEQLCDLFRSVLSIEECYADDNFFELGGTSLSASKVTMQLLSKGIKVEYQDIFDHPTPEALGAFIDAQSKPKTTEKETVEQTQSGIFEVLRHNTLEHAHEVQREPLGDVLLTGAVGFLGIHVLRELIESEKGKITCLVRKGQYASPMLRLQYMLMYYFSCKYDEAFTDRIRLIDADITDDTLSEKLRDVHFDTLINCAACVKHYAADDVLEKINVHGVENLIRLANAHNSRMIQISTSSVTGAHTDETYQKQIKLHENELFVIDSMDNKYCISKYQAELRMLEAIQNGLRGKIIRVGNLMGRQSDGEFQINFETNAFLNALKGFATIGKSPISHATDPMSFSPIDMTAKAVVLLAGTNDCFTAFHAETRYIFDEMKLIEACNRCGVTITPVDDKEYYDDYYRMLGDESINARLSALVTNDRPGMHMVEADNRFTANVLYRLGFSWPFIDDAYLDRAIRSIRTLGFFDMEDAY